jgi:hypothetical protein
VSKTSEIAERSSVRLYLICEVLALAAMFGNVRGLFFVDFPYAASKSAPVSFLYALTGFRPQAVKMVAEHTVVARTG